MDFARALPRQQHHGRNVTLNTYFVANPMDWKNGHANDPIAFVCAVRHDHAEAFADMVSIIHHSWPNSLIIAVNPGARREDIVGAMRAGAWDVLTDEYGPDAIAASINAGLRLNEPSSMHVPSLALCRKWTSLSNREKEILKLVVDGKLTKAIAFELGISVKTVDIHRTNIKRKFGNNSVASLVNMVISGGGYQQLACASVKVARVA